MQLSSRRDIWTTKIHKDRIFWKKQYFFKNNKIELQQLREPRKTGRSPCRSRIKSNE